MEIEVRKVQQVGYSTLVVSLPREWVKEVGLKQGDVVSIMREGDETLRLLPGVRKEGKQQIKSIVDADKCLEEGLLTRIITGVYIVGHDALQIVSRKGLRKEHLEEIRRTTQRLIGISVVEQTLNVTTLQNFVDPTRFPVDGLLRRLHIITSSMQDAAFQALRERKKDLASEVFHMENEVDKIYWLVVRQLLFAARDRSLGKKIGVESPLHVVGHRTAAKLLEKIGDSSESIAKEVYRILDLDLKIDEETLKDTYDLFYFVKSIYDNTIKALFSLDLKLANEMLNLVDKSDMKVEELTEKIFTKLQGPQQLKAPRMVNSTAYLSLRAVIDNLGQIADYSSTICEIAINRHLEQPGDFCTFEKIT